MPLILLSCILLFLGGESKPNELCKNFFWRSDLLSFIVTQIFITAFDLFMKLHESLEDDQELITPHQFGLLMVDWINPQKRARYHHPPLSRLNLISMKYSVDGAGGEADTHLDLAIDILVALYDSERSGNVSSWHFASRISQRFPDEDQKVFCQLLGEFHIMPGLDSRSIHKLHLLLQHHEQVNNDHRVFLSQYFEWGSSNVPSRTMLWRKFLTGSRIAS